MVKIRLTRTGRKHQPHYRIVAVDSRARRDGKYIEKIGYYNPRTSPPTFQIDKEILKKWMDNGAQLTDTVYDLLVREKIIAKTDKLREKRIKLMIKQTKADKASKEKGEEPATIPAPVKEVETPETKDEVKKEVEKPVVKEEVKKESKKEEPKTENPKEDDKKDSPKDKKDKDKIEVKTEPEKKSK